MASFWSNNLWYTCYYTVFAGRENLEEVVRTESDRFINLYYDEAMLKTEAPVIEGEYYKSLSNPYLKMEELLTTPLHIMFQHKIDIF